VKGLLGRLSIFVGGENRWIIRALGKLEAILALRSAGIGNSPSCLTSPDKIGTHPLKRGDFKWSAKVDF